MSMGSNGVRRAVTLLRPSSSIDSAVCRSCQATLGSRNYATAADTTTTDSPPPSSTSSDTTPNTTSAVLKPTYTLNAGIVVSRPPRVTRDLTPFEKAFYFYQRRLNERLALPFTRYFYFKRGTPADVAWKSKFKDRQTAARDIGKYNAYSKEAWNDELLVGAVESEPEHQIEALVKDAETTASEADMGDSVTKKEEVPRPMPRVTEADIKGDQKSLDRLLQRTLYLLVQGKEGYWKFPTTNIEKKESVRLAAERSLEQAAGVNMNTWTVGHHPIGHYIYKLRKPKADEKTGVQTLGEKTFFMKSRIMAGQADLKDNTQDLKDFKWLAKEEIQPLVNAQYWSAVKDMLAER
ncbi:54S ribosomal protein L17 mitochondrial [Arachnomyces sp. PD_36]|nr:54S ribosomal protein L17 mitochondrial [Arachnomyces sp. PD_36]